MIFHEIYSAYYNAVARILSAVQDGEADERRIREIVSEYAFGESMLTVLPALKGEKWQLLKGAKTPLVHKPTMPLTLLQKRWLKAISLDPRIRLFGVTFPNLDDVEPLFTSEDYRVYDQYGDGDPFEDESYIRRFQTILSAMKTGQNIKLELVSRTGRTIYARCIPKRLEYSEKDDKFRLVTSGCPFVRTVNLARITKCKPYHGTDVIDSPLPETDYAWITLNIRDERNALERCMMHFAHFEKRAERSGDRYLLHIKYPRDDLPEMVIRVLSFGPMAEVVGDDTFKAKIIEKLKSQKSCEF